MKKTIKFIILMLITFFVLVYTPMIVFTLNHERVHYQIEHYYTGCTPEIHINYLTLGKGSYVVTCINETNEMDKRLELHTLNEIVGYHLTTIFGIFCLFVWFFMMVYIIRSEYRFRREDET
jgi:hypothetical protein